MKEKIFSNVESAFNEILDNFKISFKEHIESSGHNASGKLASSMTWITEESSKGYTITITLPEYATYLENGTKPHWPNIDAIKKWIEIKPIMPRPLQSGKLPTTNQLAYLIGRKISIEGTQPTNIIQNTMNDFKLRSKLAESLSTIIQEEIRNQFAIKYQKSEKKRY